MIPKIVLNAGHEFTFYTREIQTMRVKERRKSDAAYTEHSLELAVFSKKPAETLHLFFCLTRQAKSLKTICACSESTDLIQYIE